MIKEAIIKKSAELTSKQISKMSVEALATGVMRNSELLSYAKKKNLPTDILRAIAKLRKMYRVAYSNRLSMIKKAIAKRSEIEEESFNKGYMKVLSSVN